MAGKRKQKDQYTRWMERDETTGKAQTSRQKMTQYGQKTHSVMKRWLLKGNLYCQTLKYKIPLPSMRKKTFAKNFSKQLKWFAHKLQVRKKKMFLTPSTRPPASSEASLCRLLGLTAKQHVDLLFDPVLVVRLVRLCVCTIPDAA